MVDWSGVLRRSAVNILWTPAAGLRPPHSPLPTLSWGCCPETLSQNTLLLDVG
jgi:hypothetical protein